MAPTARAIKWAALFVAMVAFSPTYLHPDEHLQSGEPVGSLLLGSPPAEQLPWEFDPRAACRSIFPPLLLHAPTQLVVRFVFAPLARFVSRLLPPTITTLLVSATTAILLAGPRLTVCCAHVFALRALGLHEDWLTQVGFSAVALLYAMRPFSNSLELLFVSIILACARDPVDVLRPNSYHVKNAMMIGAVTAFGCWTRFTFPIFVLPALLFVAERWMYVVGLQVRDDATCFVVR